MSFRRQTIDSIYETTGESRLIEESKVWTQKIISLMTDSAVMIDLTFKVYISIIAVMSSLAIEVRLRNTNKKRVFREIRSF